MDQKFNGGNIKGGYFNPPFIHPFESTIEDRNQLEVK